MAVVAPAWVGVGVVYVALVMGWLSRSVRRRLHMVREAFGGFDAGVSNPGLTRRTGGWLVVVALALGGLAAWDMTVRGWVGGFGLAIALFSGVVGVVMVRRPG